MSCINCDFILEEVGGVPFPNCPHLLCWKCIEDLVQMTSTTTLYCPQVDCDGFMGSETVKWCVSPEVYQQFIMRNQSTTQQASACEPQPSTSKMAIAQQQCQEQVEAAVSPESDMEFVNVTQEELVLSEEEQKSGWGQMATLIYDLIREKGMSFKEASDRVDRIPLWVSKLPISCKICLMNDIPPREGIILKNCFHLFCRVCLAKHIEISTDAEVKCPYNDGEYSCTSYLKPREMRSLVPKELYEKHYEEFSLKEAEKILPNVFHCRASNCDGFCTYDDDEGGATGLVFQCPKCRAYNCISCKAIHESGCEDYWQKLEDEENRLKQLEREARERKRQLKQDEANRITQRNNEQLSESVINGNLNSRVLMRCPKCNIPGYKYTGCNHIVCSYCKHSYNWSGLEPGTYR